MASRLRRIVVPPLLTLLLVATASPAFAAAKVFEEHVRNQLEFEITPDDVPDPVCGVTVAGGKAVMTNQRVVEWDDGRVLMHFNQTLVLYDDRDRPILRDRALFRIVVAPDHPEVGASLLTSQALRLVAQCTGHSETPGKLIESYLSVVVNKDGELRQFRLLLCDTDVHPFCV